MGRSSIRMMFHPDAVCLLQAMWGWAIPYDAYAFPEGDIARGNRMPHINLLHGVTGPDVLSRAAPALLEHSVTRVTVERLWVSQGRHMTRGIPYDLVLLEMAGDRSPSLLDLRASLRTTFPDATDSIHDGWVPRIPLARVLPGTPIPYDRHMGPVLLPVHTIEVTRPDGIIETATADGRLLDYR